MTLKEYVNQVAKDLKVNDECSTCKGKGKIFIENDVDDGEWKKCPDCSGEDFTSSVNEK